MHTHYSQQHRFKISMEILSDWSNSEIPGEVANGKVTGPMHLIAGLIKSENSFSISITKMMDCFGWILMILAEFSNTGL